MASIFTCTNIYIYIYLHRYITIYISIFLHLYICLYVCLYIHTHILKQIQPAQFQYNAICMYVFRNGHFILSNQFMCSFLEKTISLALRVPILFVVLFFYKPSCLLKVPPPSVLSILHSIDVLVQFMLGTSQMQILTFQKIQSKGNPPYLQVLTILLHFFQMIPEFQIWKLYCIWICCIWALQLFIWFFVVFCMISICGK